MADGICSPCWQTVCSALEKHRPAQDAHNFCGQWSHGQPLSTKSPSPDVLQADFPPTLPARVQVQPPILLQAVAGGEPGRCAVWRGDLEDCYYQKAIHRVRPSSSLADSDFLAYWIRLQALTGAFDDRNAKTTIAHLPLIRLGQMLVPAIAVEEQRRFAARLKAQLTELDTTQQAARAQLQEIDRLPQRLLTQAFNDVEARP